MTPKIGQTLIYCITNCGTQWVPLMVVRVKGEGPFATVAGHIMTSPDDQLNVDGLPPHLQSTVRRLDKGRWWADGAPRWVEGQSPFGHWAPAT